MTDNTIREPLRAAPGFVLVGVIMLILALTILGLSLFSLSSYESQFLGHSVDELQVFHTASGAFERAQIAMAVTGQLQSVQSNLPPDVDSTIASQEQSGIPVTSGNVDWSENAKDVFIRVRASHGGVVRTMQASFTPQQRVDLYSRLVTAAGTLSVPNLGGSAPYNNIPRWSQTYLNGAAWVGLGSDTTWLPAKKPAPIVARATPVPSVADYRAVHWPSATNAPAGKMPGTDLFYEMWAPAGGAAFFRSVAKSGEDYSLLVAAGKFAVHGTVVWMFDKGFRSEDLVEIHGSGSSEDCLIMVAEKNTEDPAYPIGVWFFGGVKSDSVPVILVSDKEVRLEHSNTATSGAGVNYLSIYAKDVWLMGPVAPPTGSGILTLIHPQVEPDAIIDRLNTLNVLPGQTATTRNFFSFVSGSWLESP